MCRALSNLRSWLEQKVQEGRILSLSLSLSLPYCLSWDISSFFFCPRTEICTICSPGSQAFALRWLYNWLGFPGSAAYRSRLWASQAPYLHEPIPHNKSQSFSLSRWRSRYAAAAAKSLQSCPTLCDPIDGSPPGTPVPEILQARTLEWGAISFSNAWKWRVKVKSLSRVRLLATPWTAAHQAPPPMGFSRQEYWSGVPLPSPGEVDIDILKCYWFCFSKHTWLIQLVKFTLPWWTP